MIVTAWKGGTYGIRVGSPNNHRHFKKTWKTIEVVIDRHPYVFSLTPTFWTTCPEFRGGPIPSWLRRNRLASWSYGKPPRLKLIPLGGNRFRLNR